VLTSDVLSPEIANAHPAPAPPAYSAVAAQLGDKLRPALDRMECNMIKAALRDHHGKMDAVAKALGISRKGLYLKRQRFGL
jgi:DNA-binding NtrC family response regulator